MPYWVARCILWTTAPERDALAQETLGKAALEAGFTHIAYQLEPIAAALDYEQRVDQETIALVVDIGGGTRTSPSSV